MSLASDAVKGFALAHALPVVGLLFSLAVVAYGGYEWRVRAAHSDGFHAGYAQARDSVAIKAQREKRDSAVAHAEALRDSVKRYTAVIDSERSRFANVERHTPRIEAIPLPDSLTRIPDPVLVTVASTGEHFVLPRGAARYWFVSDSLVAVAAKLLDKYQKANAQWASAWSAEHSARIASDSLVALLQSRTAPPAPKARRWPWVVAGVVAGVVASHYAHR